MNQLLIFIPIAISAIAFPVQLFALERSPKNNSVAIFHPTNIEQDLVAQNDLNFLLAQDFFSRGKQKLEQQDYQGAIEEFNRASIEDSNNADAYFCRGGAYSQLKKHESAIADYNRALKIDPELIVVYVNRSVIYKVLGKYKQAIADHTKAIEIDPEQVSAYINRGNSYDSLETYKQAVVDYAKAIEIAPKPAIVVHAYNISNSCRFGSTAG